MHLLALKRLHNKITGYEKNNREPDVLKIKKLAYALDITGDDLLGIEPQKSTDFSREDLPKS